MFVDDSRCQVLIKLADTLQLTPSEFRTWLGIVISASSITTRHGIISSVPCDEKEHHCVRAITVLDTRSDPRTLVGDKYGIDSHELGHWVVADINLESDQTQYSENQVGGLILKLSDAKVAKYEGVVWISAVYGSVTIDAIETTSVGVHAQPSYLPVMTSLHQHINKFLVNVREGTRLEEDMIWTGNELFLTSGNMKMLQRSTISSYIRELS